MQAGTVIGKAWDMYEAHWRHLLPIAFVVYVLISLLILLLGSLGWLGTVVGFFVSIAGVSGCRAHSSSPWTTSVTAAPTSPSARRSSG